MRIVLVAVLVAVCVGGAYAELQNVQVGGSLTFRGRIYHNVLESPAPRVHIPNFFLVKRPIGNALGVISPFRHDSEGNDLKDMEGVMLLNVKADFTNDVSAFIELYDYWQWGEDFRSNYITGADFRANSADDIEVEQAYIEMNNIMDLPLRLRIGRQNLMFGKGFLMDDRMTGVQLRSYDAIRLTYDVDAFSVDAFYAKLAETGIAEEDGDVDLYGIYATYKALEPVDISLYWFWLRDARMLNETNFVWFVEWLEDIFNVDDYDVTNLHTIGLRLNGAMGGFDYDLELAYQFGDAGANGFGFDPIMLLYGDDDAEYDNWGMDLIVGYTFDCPWSPRVYMQGLYFSGEDNRDISFWDWLNPFYRPQASVSFNRLFAGGYGNYTPAMCDNACTTNFYKIALGVDLKPRENLFVRAQVGRLWVDEPFDFPVSFELFGLDIPIAPALSFWTREGDDDLGWDATLYVKYDYSEDLCFGLYINHVFVDDGLTDGAYIFRHGTLFSGGTDDDDITYVEWKTSIKF